MLSNEYSHALKLQLGFIKAGFFPIGSTEVLQQFVHDHLKSGASQNEAMFYKLTSTPFFTKPEITEQAIVEKMQRVIKGEDTLVISSEKIRTQAVPIVGRISSAFSSAKEVLEGVKGGRFDPLQLTATIGQFQNVARDITTTVDNVTEKIDNTFWNVNTDDYIRNEHGVFVSLAWLENPQNASFVGRVRFKHAAPGARPK